MMARLKHSVSIRKAKKKLIGSYNERPLEPLKPGQVRCPACGRGSSITSTGKLRYHFDPDGIECPQRLVGGQEALPIDPVVLEELRRPSRPPSPPARKGSSRPRTAIGVCHECQKPVTGERQFCGQCLRKRGRM